MARKPSSKGSSSVGEGRHGIAGNQGGSPSLAPHLRGSTPGSMRLRVSILALSVPTQVFALDCRQAPRLRQIPYTGQVPVGSL
jgi:hypothetical protein